MAKIEFMPASGFNHLKLIKASLNHNIHYRPMIHFIQNMPDSFGTCKRSESIPLTSLLIVDSDEVIHIHAIKKNHQYFTFRMLLYSLMLSFCTPRYWRRARDHTLGYLMQEMSWCMVAHAHAPHQIYTSHDCTTPTRFC